MYGYPVYGYQGNPYAYGGGYSNGYGSGYGAAWAIIIVVIIIFFLFWGFGSYGGNRQCQ